MRQIFGRQPAAIVAAIQSFLVFGASFHWFTGIGINTQNDVALVVAVLAALGGLYTAWGTTETALAAVIEFFKAGLALAAIYGLKITLEQTGMAIAAINAFFTLVVLHPKTSPLAVGTFKQPGV